MRRRVRGVRLCWGRGIEVLVVMVGEEEEEIMVVGMVGMEAMVVEEEGV